MRVETAYRKKILKQDTQRIGKTDGSDKDRFRPFLLPFFRRGIYCPILLHRRLHVFHFILLYFILLYFISIISAVSSAVFINSSIFSLKRSSDRRITSTFGLVTGCFATKIVQQSSKGWMDVS